MSPDRVSFQLYSARSVPSLEEQFALLSRIGYRNVEPYGGLLGDAALLKRLLDQHHVQAPSIHVGFDRLRADPRATASLCKTLGTSLVFVPAPPPDERDKDAEGWRALGRELAEIGRVVTGEGLKFGWHNHHWEYKPTTDGALPLDLMFAEAPDLLWEADLAWIVRGGADPAVEIEKHKDRLVAVHVKDIAPQGEAEDEEGWADVGYGVLDWPRIMTAVRGAGVELFVLEHDKPSDPARFAERSFATVSRW